MPSRAYTSLLLVASGPVHSLKLRVNALSGLYLIVTLALVCLDAVMSICVNALSGLYLIVTCLIVRIASFVNSRVNALSGLYLIVTVPLQKPRFYAVSRACFCRYLSEYSDSNCFSCMLTIWTYLTRYTHL